jgi:hypothetical protein
VTTDTDHREGTVMSTTRLRTVAVAATASLLLSACGGNDEAVPAGDAAVEDDRDTATQVEAAPDEPEVVEEDPAEVEAAVLDAYIEFIGVVDEAWRGRGGDEVTEEEAQEAISQVTDWSRIDGNYAAFVPNFAEVRMYGQREVPDAADADISVDGNKADMTVCMLDRRFYFLADEDVSDVRVEGLMGQYVEADVSLERDRDGRWMVVAYDELLPDHDEHESPYKRCLPTAAEDVLAGHITSIWETQQVDNDPERIRPYVADRLFDVLSDTMQRRAGDGNVLTETEVSFGFVAVQPTAEERAELGGLPQVGNLVTGVRCAEFDTWIVRRGDEVIHTEPAGLRETVWVAVDMTLPDQPKVLQQIWVERHEGDRCDGVELPHRYPSNG